MKKVQFLLYRRQSGGGCGGFVHGCRCHLAWRGDSWAKHPWPHPLGGTPLTTAQSWGGGAWGWTDAHWLGPAMGAEGRVCASEQRPLGSSSVYSSSPGQGRRPWGKPRPQGWASPQAGCAGGLDEGRWWTGRPSGKVRARRPLLMLGHVSTSAVGKRAQQAGVRFREGGVLDSMKGGGGGGGEF